MLFRPVYTLPSDGNGEPLITEHSHWSMFKYKKDSVFKPMRELELWDFPTSVTIANVDQQEKHDFSDKMLYFSAI